MLLLDVPLSYLRDPKSPPIVISATYARGFYESADSFVLLHSPAETEESNVFTLKLNSDFSGIDLVRQQYGVRTTNPDDKLAVELGAWSGFVGTLPIVVSVITFEVKLSTHFYEPFRNL